MENDKDTSSNSNKVPANNTGISVFLGLIGAGALIAASIVYTNGGFSLKSSSSPSPNVVGGGSQIEGGSQLEKRVSLAKSVGLDEGDFSKCLEDNKHKDEVSKDLSDSGTYGAQATPTFFVGKSSGDGNISAQSIVGARDYNTFKQVIDSWLSEGKAKEIKVGEEIAVESTLSEVSIDDDAVKGDSNAPVTIIEFSDYECPFCQRHFQTVYSALREEYVDTGKVKYVFRDLPLSSHDPVATDAAIAANCARELGGDEKYYEYHDAYFTATQANGRGL